MNLTEYTLLLVFSPSKEKEVMKQVLTDRGFTVHHSSKPELAIQKAIQILPDLIIYQDNLPGLTGFQAYNQLKAFLVKNQISFFIYTEKPEQEDIVIGLEMGIDNFILTPVNETSLLNKIEHQFHKQKDFWENEKEKFKNSFDITPVAKVILHNLTIQEANHPFIKLFPDAFITTMHPLISDIFDFSSPRHSLPLRKCLNGLLDVCNFERVPLVINDHQTFDLHFLTLTRQHEIHFLTELFPSIPNNHNYLDQTDDFESEILIHLPHPRWRMNGIKLTQREEEVLDLSSTGLPLKQIADKLGLSQRTIEKHRSNIMKKTNTNCILEAINVLQFKNKSL